MLFLVASISGFGQTSLHRRADRCYTRFEFVTAADLYEKIVKRYPVAKMRLTQLKPAATGVVNREVNRIPLMPTCW
jgi:hypothetical protein